MNPKLGLFCKSFKADLDWLYFAVNSFRENWKTDSQMVLVVEPDCQFEIERWKLPDLRVVSVQPWRDGYTHAMAMKANADLFLPKCDLILLFDSDFMLTAPTTLEDLLEGGMPVLRYDVWHTDIDQETRQVSKKVWGPAVRRSTGRDLAVDWMVDSRWVFWSSTFKGARSLIEEHCRMPFLQAVYSDHQYDWHRFTEHPQKFCDLQTLGIYASEFEQHKYVIKQRTRTDLGPLHQGWSHSVDKPSLPLT